MLHDALVERVRRRPGDPLITWYGHAGRREELSAVTFANAVAKTAGLLTDEWDLVPETRVSLRLPLHWQAAVWLAACDIAGLTVVWDHDGDIVVSDRVDEADIAVSTAPFGLPNGEIPAGVLDHARDALGQPDDYLGPVIGGCWQVDGRRWDEGVLRDRVADLISRHGARPLVTGPLTADVAPAVWPLPPLADSVVLLGDPNGDPGAIAASEHTTGIVGGEP
ncbi:MAG: TIGR03089 family protein [Candidatus Nanopelagicales bacterium]